MHVSMLGKKKNKPAPRVVATDVFAFRMIRATSFFLIGLLVVVFLAVSWFLYTHIYQTVGTVQAIIEYQAQSGVEVIQFDLYEKVKAEWDWKQTSTSTLSRDPFRP